MAQLRWVYRISGSPRTSNSSPDPPICRWPTNGDPVSGSIISMDDTHTGAKRVSAAVLGGLAIKLDKGDRQLG